MCVRLLGNLSIKISYNQGSLTIAARLIWIINSKSDSQASKCNNFSLVWVWRHVFQRYVLSWLVLAHANYFNNLKEMACQSHVAFTHSKGWCLPRCRSLLSNFFAKYNMVPTTALFGHLKFYVITLESSRTILCINTLATIVFMP